MYVVLDYQILKPAVNHKTRWGSGVPTGGASWISKATEEVLCSRF
jgi:hypothetical protein